MKKLFLFALLFLLSSCAAQKTFKLDPAQTLNMNLGYEPASLDFALATDSYSFDIISNIMVGLTRYSVNEKGEPIIVPGIASSWDISKDGLEYIFHLRDDAYWTDGVKVSAKHFMDSFARTLDPATGASFTNMLAMIDFNKTKALDDQTLKIVLKYPAAYFIYMTAYRFTLPVRLDVIAKHGNSWTEPENIVSNGPFILKDWFHEYKIVLERSESFYDYKPNYQEQNQVKYLRYFMIPEQSSAYTLFKKSELDWIDLRSIPINELKKINLELDRSNNLSLSKKAIKIERTPLLYNYYVAFNYSSGPFNDLSLRKAFAYAIDRKAFVKVHSQGGFPLDRWIPPMLNFFYDKEKAKSIKSYDPELAKKYLAQSSFKKNSQGKYPDLSFYVPSSQDSKLLAETLQAMWKEVLGIEVKIHAMEWKVFLQKLRDNPPDIHRMGWGADYPDPDTFMQIFTSKDTLNYGKWFNDDYDNLIYEAAGQTDQYKRRELYRQAESLLLDKDCVIAPLYAKSQTIIRKDNIGGLKLNSLDLVFLDKVKKFGIR